MPSILYITPIDNYNTTLHNITTLYNITTIDNITNITTFIDINNTLYSEMIKENKEDEKNIGALVFIIFMGIVVIINNYWSNVWVKESNHTKIG